LVWQRHGRAISEKQASGRIYAASMQIVPNNQPEKISCVTMLHVFLKMFSSALFVRDF